MADFVQPVNALFTDARLTDGDRTVYCLLLTFADYGTLANCRPSVATVARRGGRDRSAVVRSLTKLVELGWVTRQARKTVDGDSDTSMYSFPFQVVGVETHLPSCQDAPTVVAETHQQVGAQMHLGVVAETHHNLEPSHQEPRTETSTTAKRARTRSRPAEAFQEPTLADTQAHFREWLRDKPDLEAETCWTWWKEREFKRGKDSIKDWKLTCRTWALRCVKNGSRAVEGAAPVERARQQPSEVNLAFERYLAEKAAKETANGQP